MKPHKHAELIKAWADGATAQSLVHGKWQDREYPTWWEELEWRIKPEPKPDFVRFAFAQGYKILTYDVDVDYKSYHNLKLTWDGETGKLKSAEVL